MEGLAEQDRGCAEGKAQLHSFITLHLSQFLRGKNDSLSLSLSLYRSDERVSANLLVYIRDSTLCCGPRRPDAQPDGSPQDPQPAASQHNASHHHPGVYAVLTADQALFDFLLHGSQQAKPACEWASGQGRVSNHCRATTLNDRGTAFPVHKTVAVPKQHLQPPVLEFNSCATITPIIRHNCRSTWLDCDCKPARASPVYQRPGLLFQNLFIAVFVVQAPSVLLASDTHTVGHA